MNQRKAVRYFIKNFYKYDLIQVDNADNKIISSSIFDRYEQKIIMNFNTEKQAEKRLDEIHEKFGLYGKII